MEGRLPLSTLLAGGDGRVVGDVVWPHLAPTRILLWTMVWAWTLLGFRHRENITSFKGLPSGESFDFMELKMLKARFHCEPFSQELMAEL